MFFVASSYTTPFKFFDNSHPLHIPERSTHSCETYSQHLLFSARGIVIAKAGDLYIWIPSESYFDSLLLFIRVYSGSLYCESWSHVGGLRRRQEILACCRLGHHRCLLHPMSSHWFVCEYHLCVLFACTCMLTLVNSLTYWGSLSFVLNYLVINVPFGAASFILKSFTAK